MVAPQPHVGELRLAHTEYRTDDVPKVACIYSGLSRRLVDRSDTLIRQDRLEDEGCEQVALSFKQQVSTLLD